MDVVSKVTEGTGETVGANGTNAKLQLSPIRVKYFDELENILATIEPTIRNNVGGKINSRWIALRLMEGESGLLESLSTLMGLSPKGKEKVSKAVSEAHKYMSSIGISPDQIRDRVVTRIVKTCENIYAEVVKLDKKEYAERDRKFDKFLTSKLTGIPVMILLLFIVFWITISGANYPSTLLSKCSVFA